jgi:hypothetical protein
MSSANGDVVLRRLEAYNAGDIDTFIELLRTVVQRSLAHPASHSTPPAGC